VQPEARKNEVLGRLREGLEDVPISRPITDDPATQFGIRMPDDPSHRIYVWIDALFNYLTAVDTPERRGFWPADVHLIGKEILWFHACIWPAILHALGEDLPRMVYAHSHYIREGRKMSKSLGNFIDLSVIDAYRAKYSTDALRWYLITQGPLGVTDADFTHAKFVEVYNAYLANGIGNSSNRVSNMIGKYFDGRVPASQRSGFRYKSPKSSAATSLELEYEWKERAKERVADVHNSFTDGAFDLARALQQGMSLVHDVDGFINDAEPFRLAKRTASDPRAQQELEEILYACAESLRIASLILYPAMPEKMTELWRRWNCAPPPGVPLTELAQWGGPHSLKPGTRLEIGEPLFMRADPTEAPPA
jgi:methionyl-tRNA synthetase